jgi:hypothetical protein
VSRLTQGRSFALPVRGCHPLRRAFPSASGCLGIVTGLVRVRSPLLAESRLMSFPPGTEMFQFPGFASPTYGLSERYPKGVGCPIRISTDQRLLAAPRGFSQRATSFIASWCQGIHRMPFSRSRSCSSAISDRGEVHHAQKPSTQTHHAAMRIMRTCGRHPSMARDPIELVGTPSNTFDGNPRWEPVTQHTTSPLNFPMKREKAHPLRSDLPHGTSRDAPEPDSP